MGALEVAAVLVLHDLQPSLRTLVNVEGVVFQAYGACEVLCVA